jgi:hypothetical protein
MILFLYSLICHYMYENRFCHTYSYALGFLWKNRCDTRGPSSQSPLAALNLLGLSLGAPNPLRASLPLGPPQPAFAPRRSLSLVGGTRPSSPSSSSRPSQTRSPTLTPSARCTSLGPHTKEDATPRQHKERRFHSKPVPPNPSYPVPRRHFRKP